jgi:diaminopimelate decarboxylase
MKHTPNSLTTGQNGLQLGGIDIAELVAQYGSPLYLMDEATLRGNCRLYTEPLAQHYPNSKVLYAGKANLNLPLINIMHSEGMGLDVVSGGELYTALKSNMNPHHIYFHGNNKSVDELRLALKHGVNIVLDNEQELDNIVSLTQEGLDAKVMIRLKPEIEAHTHDYIKTGQIDSKFGFDKRELGALAQKIAEQNNVKYLGIHSHIGSQIFDTEPFLDSVDIMLGYADTIRDASGLETEQLNLGGGIGIQYTEADNPPEIPAYMEAVCMKVKEACQKRGIAEPTLLFEPGRSIVGNAGITVYTVGTIKEIENVKTYIFVDGGMADNPRPMMYQAEYTYDLVHQPGVKGDREYAIAGKFCESGDVLTHKVVLPEVSVGDLLVVYGTGAYNYVMASNYNRAVRPAMVLVSNGQHRELIKRETWDDLMRYDQKGNV